MTLTHKHNFTTHLACSNGGARTDNPHHSTHIPKNQNKTIYEHRHTIHTHKHTHTHTWHAAKAAL